jgi:hypothetical protein
MQLLLSRRDVCKALLAISLNGVMARRGEAAVSTGGMLESFDYSGVRLLDGMPAIPGTLRLRPFSGPSGRQFSLRVSCTRRQAPYDPPDRVPRRSAGRPGS